jgi:hypothetical protein
MIFVVALRQDDLWPDFTVELNAGDDPTSGVAHALSNAIN